MSLRKYGRNSSLSLTFGAVPRDYFCSHILYLFGQMKLRPNEKVDSIIEEFLNEWLADSDNASKKVIKYPVSNERVVKSHREFMLSYYDDSIYAWIEPHLSEIRKVCKVIGINKKWNDYYELHDENIVRIKEDFPPKKKDCNANWPIVTLNEI